MDDIDDTIYRLLEMAVDSTKCAFEAMGGVPLRDEERDEVFGYSEVAKAASATAAALMQFKEIAK